MTTMITQRPTNPRLQSATVNFVVMLMAAIGIAAMTIATQPFSAAIPPAPVDSSPWRHAVSVDLTPIDLEWCCLGSKPAERLGKGFTDVAE